MRTLILAAAAGLAALAFSGPAAAQWSGGGSGSGGSGHWTHWSGGSGHHDGHQGNIRNSRFAGGNTGLRGRSPDGAWGYYEGDYDANRSFDPDKWNDWWHDRPDRAFPRWVQNNQNCTADRVWWSGNGWHC